MDTCYAAVDEVDRLDGLVEADPHEFELVDNGSSFLRTGRIRNSSSSPLSKNGVVGESSLQRVDVSSEEGRVRMASIESYSRERGSSDGFPQLDHQ